MADDNYLHEKHFHETGRMPPVLLGVASAAIGFAFHETADRELTNSLWLVLAAVLSWAVSFGAGVTYSKQLAAAIQGNIALNIAEQARRDDWRTKSKGKFDAANTAASKAYLIQQWALLLGAGLYLAGHIWHLAEAKPKPETYMTSPVKGLPAERTMNKPTPTIKTETPQGGPRSPGVKPSETNPAPSRPSPKPPEKPKG